MQRTFAKIATGRAMYNVHINHLGISTTANYKANSVNKEKYRFGDKLSVSSLVYYPIVSSRTVISPDLGLVYEHTKASELNNNKIDLTGGHILNGSLGAEISFGKIATGFNVQLPVAQKFAENQTKERVKGTLHVSIAI